MDEALSPKPDAVGRAILRHGFAASGSVPVLSEPAIRLVAFPRHAGKPERGTAMKDQSLPRKGWTYCSAMSQGKKIQVSWLTSVI